MRLISPIHLGLALLALAGCELGILDPIITAGLTTDSSGNVTVTTDPDPETTADPSIGTLPSTGGDDSVTSSDSSDSPPDETGTSTSGANFIDPPGPSAGCDLWTQDCPSGEKCSAAGPPPFSNDSVDCSPIVPDPDQFGEECEVLVEGHLGPDTCDIGLYCHDVDADTGKGTCTPICTGSLVAPTCDAGFTCFDVLAVPLCVPECDPLLQGCPAGQACNYRTYAFGCWPIADEPRQESEVCEDLDQCAPGLMCLATEYAAECDPSEIGCCTAYCDLDDPGVCPGAGEICRPFFLPGDAPSEHQDVGVCALPE